MREIARKFAGGLVIGAFFLAGCGSGDSADTANTNPANPEPLAEATQNACPIDGCEIRIDAVQASGDEFELTWSANFVPDFSKNHIHVYWDTYTAGQVSSDATAQGLEQGVWVPTDAYPTYTTAEVVSTAERNGSTTLCVTTSDGDHNVISKDLVHCADVSSYL